MPAFDRLIVGAVLALTLGLCASPVEAQLGGAPSGVGLDEHVGQSLPLDAAITDSHGTEHLLGEFFGHGKPVILTLAYYHCSALCDTTLRELAKRTTDLGWTLGRDYDAMTVSIDPHDPLPVAAAKRDHVLRLLGMADSQQWPFFVARPASIAAIASALGYRYVYDPQSDQYAHPAVVFVLTPEGKVARYLYGVASDLRSLRLALREARLGRGGPTALVDRVILSCFHYDPKTRRYELLIAGVMRGGSALFAVALGALILLFVRRGRRLRHASALCHAKGLSHE